jgi:DNA-binding response OmpR family regulator
MMRILVVDDDERIARMLLRGLTLEGYQADVADDGDQALRMVTQTAY